jgi:hypothetical protein
MDILIENRQRDVFFQDDGHIIFIPQGWADFFYEVDEEDGPCVYGYGYGQHAGETLWYPVDKVNKLPEVTEEQAKQIDPDLFKELDRIDKEG